MRWFWSGVVYWFWSVRGMVLKCGALGCRCSLMEEEGREARGGGRGLPFFTWKAMGRVELPSTFELGVL